MSAPRVSCPDRRRRRLWWGVNLVAFGACAVALLAGGLPATGPATEPATSPSGAMGPDVVVLRELVNLYEAVPFDHKSHARMAEMWDGCVTCHHRNPETSATMPATARSTNGYPAASTQAATTSPASPAILAFPLTQASSAQFPACKTCHPVQGQENSLHLPGLKGAYHRQCLNCHREWSGANDCVKCHRPLNGNKIASPLPTPDDIVGRMHPPMTAPVDRPYKARFTPADGSNVLFRHEEHIKGYGLKCVACHRHDNCSHCHQRDNGKPRVAHVLKPAETWAESHGPCIGCHTQTRCRGCHYKDDQPPPPPFAHAMTGQTLDADHVKLSCNQCHPALRSKAHLGCGGSSCHKRGDVIAYPHYRPGPFVATQPATRATAVESLEPVKGILR